MEEEWELLPHSSKIEIETELNASLVLSDSQSWKMEWTTYVSETSCAKVAIL
jgi:hypothetical protein